MIELVCGDSFIKIFDYKEASVPTSVEKAKKFGEIFGICFQIKNDLNFESAKRDKYNGIYTVKDIIGIEKTQDLLDNYKEEMNDLIKDFPENIYKESLKDLIELL